MPPPTRCPSSKRKNCAVSHMQLRKERTSEAAHLFRRRTWRDDRPGRGLSLIAQAEGLANSPHIGMPMPERPGTRISRFGTYLIIYRADSARQTVRILRFPGPSRRLPREAGRSRRQPGPPAAGHPHRPRRKCASAGTSPHGEPLAPTAERDRVGMRPGWKILPPRQTFCFRRTPCRTPSRTNSS